jgi:sec-independent protein translocase protein TatA
MMGNLGFGEMMMIMVIVLVLFGAKRVPEISASFGKGIREFKRNLNDIQHSVISAVPESPRSAAEWTPLPAADSPTEPATARTNVDQEREPKRLL